MVYVTTYNFFFFQGIFQHIMIILQKQIYVTQKDRYLQATKA